jgi:hypothetical protein
VRDGLRFEASDRVISAGLAKAQPPLCATALILMCCGPASAQLPDASPGRSEISAKNVLCGLVLPNPAPRRQATSLTGSTTNGKSFRIDEAGKEIPARRGIAFGIAYTLKSFLGTGVTPIRVVFTYPAPGLRDPKTGRLSLTSEDTSVKKYDVPQLESYTFDEDWKLAPGRWLVQVFDRRKKLAECAFTVANPK